MSRRHSYPVIVCYDCADDRRRDRLARALLDFGDRIQESVFECVLDDELLDRLRQRIEALCDPAEDRVHLFRLCGACAEQVVLLGAAARARTAGSTVV